MAKKQYRASHSCHHVDQGIVMDYIIYMKNNSTAMNHDNICT